MQNPKMPAIYISKYNRFVDNIITRINRMLGKSYDPVRVKLQSNKDVKKKDKTAPKRKKNNKKPNQKPKQNLAPAALTNKMAEIPISRSINGKGRETAYVLVSKAPANIKATPRPTQNKATPAKKKKNQNTKKNKPKATTKPKNQKAKATLFGLSSIKRDGDVSVNVMSDHTTVKTNFIVGPLTLRVEREMNRGAKREVKSATATTAEMHGRLTLRIIHGGAATLHSIKVLQPKQVRVESTDNHDKTKEFMWRRSPTIASLVSQKLTSATKTMLKPPPKQA